MISKGQGLNVRTDDVKQFANMLTIFRDVPRLEPNETGEMKEMRKALETIARLAPTMLANGDRALVKARAVEYDEQTVEPYDEMQHDLRKVLDATRTILLNGRFRYRPERKKDLRNYWQGDAEFLGIEVCRILTARSNHKFGLGKENSPALPIVQSALEVVHNEVFTHEAIVGAIRRKAKADNSYKEVVSMRANTIRGKIAPDTSGHPGKLESDNEPVPPSNRRRSKS